MIESNAKPHGPSQRTRCNSVLIGVVVFFFAFNAATARFLSGGPNDQWLEAIYLGAIVFQPIALGMWAALAGSSMLINVSLALPCLMLLIVATGLDRNVYTDVQRSEFFYFALTGITVFAVAALVFGVVAGLARLRIVSDDKLPQAAAPRLRFSIKYLLVLTTLFALVLAIVTQLSFQTEPPPPNWIFGPGFFIYILAVGGSTLTAAILPTMSLPLIILYGRATRGVLWIATTVWAGVPFLVALIWGAFEDEWPDILLFLLLVQLGAAIAGAMSAVALRFGGFRLVRREPLVPST
jgi:hypothetical protein